MLSNYETYDRFVKQPADPYIEKMFGGLYDPANGHMHHKTIPSSLIGYWAMAIMATVLDLLPRLFIRFKTQGARSYFSVGEWLEAVSVSMANQLLVAPLVYTPLVAWMR